MRKIRLNADALVVESYATEGLDHGRRGTVLGHSGVGCTDTDPTFSGNVQCICPEHLTGWCTRPEYCG
jgi:hypothetical protein